MADNNQSFFSFKPDHQVILPKTSVSLTVEKRDWIRLKKVVSRCDNQTDWWGLFCSAFIGIAGSAGITCFSIYTAEPPISFYVLLCATIAALIAALICGFGVALSKKHSKFLIEEITDAIKEIEDNLPKEQKDLIQ